MLMWASGVLLIKLQGQKQQLVIFLTQFILSVTVIKTWYIV